MTPFEMAGCIFEVKAPIFVFREWHRHRTQSYNEMSARYTPLPNENYIPEAEDLITRAQVAQKTTNRQASSNSTGINEVVLTDWLHLLKEHYHHAEQLYQHGLKAGVPKELARLVIPVARYSKMRASANLRNWLAFLELRMASNAQQEIRDYANAIHSVLQPIFPRTIGLFDGR